MAERALESFSRFNYLLRPSKQVERKLFIEALHRLSLGNFRIHEYTYLGFGSPYFADFILFHKYLYIDKMICVEKANIPKRMEFNRPFRFIRLQMTNVADVLPKLKRRAKYLVWLDYDYLLNREILNDIAGFIYLLSPGSIFIVTVEAEPRLPADQVDGEMSGSQYDDRLFQTFQEELGKYYPGTIKRNQLARNTLPTLFAEIIRTRFEEEASKRELQFFQLFNFKYADGAQMLSIGGMIGNGQTEEQLGKSGVYNLDFIETSTEPKRISVPPLTVREKQWLDKNLRPRLNASNLQFELHPEFLETFRQFYRHYPIYYETLI
jgi:hypothetical protein